VSVPAGDQARALAALNADPDVRYAAPNVRLRVAARELNDPYYLFQWPLGDSGVDADIDIEDAWELTEGLGVNVAVIDQQVDVAHPDLAGAIEPGAADFVPAGAGCKAPAPVGRADHGTHVAGIVAARANNDMGIAGVAPLSHVVPVRAFDNCGVSDLEWVLKALRYAAAHAPIVTASFATDPLADPADRTGVNQAFRDLFEEFQSTLFVFASGNEGADLDGEDLPVYPCSTSELDGSDPINAVCVGVSGKNDEPVCWGNVGSGSVDLLAPGVNIFSTVRASPGSELPKGTYASLDGTSMSAAMVAGVAALARSADESAAGPELKDYLLEVDRIPGMESVAASMGRVNAARAVIPREGDLGAGGPGGIWDSCDPDHDGARRDTTPPDDCPDVAGPVRGCPDEDHDGVPDREDNCRHDANPNQQDRDGDGEGDRCDSTPLGPDVDGDGRPALEDRCPTVYAQTADGCPIIVVDPPLPGGGGGGGQPSPGPAPAPPSPPAPPAQAANWIVSLGARVTPRRCSARQRCRKAARVTVRLSRSARVAVKVERRVRKNGRWRWQRVATRSLVVTARGRSLTVRGTRGRSLRKGSYRVTAMLAGAPTAAYRFRV
jgi:thermitase